jgi:hypothetical protein
MIKFGGVVEKVCGKGRVVLLLWQEEAERSEKRDRCEEKWRGSQVKTVER